MSLQVNMTGNQTGFQQMLNSARTQAKGFANSITHEVSSSWSLGNIGKQFAGMFAGLASFEGVKRGLEWFINTGDQIKDTAEQIDMSADSWQRWSDAVERAGLSTSGFMRVVEALRQKRTDALTDPKARGQLNRLGFSDADITGDMEMGEFVRRALKNGSMGDVQRNALSDVIGSRGVKYTSALGELPNAKAIFSDDDLKQADELERNMKDLSKAVGMATVATIRTFSNNEGGDKQRRLMKNFWLLGKPTDEQLVGPRRGIDPWAKPTDRKSDKPVNNVPGSNQAKSVTASDFNKDPLDALLEKQREDQALADQQRKQRLIDSKRGLMLIGDRRASIQGEIGTLADQIAARGAKMNGEDFLSDADKKSLEGVTGKAREYQVNQLRQKYQSTTDDLEIRKERLTGELREKPLKFNTDSMSKVGLYSASAVAFNPLLGIAQRQLHELQAIRQKLSGPTGKDPHAP